MYNKPKSKIIIEDHQAHGDWNFYADMIFRKKLGLKLHKVAGIEEDKEKEIEQQNPKLIAEGTQKDLYLFGTELTKKNIDFEIE